MIGVGVYYIFVDQIELYFSDQLTFSNTCGRMSCRNYGLALPLPSPEMLSLSSKSRIFLLMGTFALFVQMDDTITHTNA